MRATCAGRVARRASTRRGLGAAWSVVVALALAGCGQQAVRPAQPQTDGRLVLVSGRDDHGLVALPSVPLHRTVEGAALAGSAADGTLARVVDSDGEWQEVETLEGPPARGWIDDFHLRGVIHLVGPQPTCVPRVGGHPVPAGEQATLLAVGGGQVRVRTQGASALTGWVPRSQVRELPPMGPACGDGSDARTDSHHH